MKIKVKGVHEGLDLCHFPARKVVVPVPKVTQNRANKLST